MNLVHAHPDTLDHGDHWRDRGNCNGIDNPDRMFPGRQDRDIRAAKLICHGCPVKQRCLEDALAREEGIETVPRHGVFGGHTGPERRRIYERRRKAST
jgi:WhiB family redox-sensing transcriptional regulator